LCHMRRFHLFEFNDWSWFPSSWRIMLTDLLKFFWSFGIFDSNDKHVATHLLNSMKKMGTCNLYDLCSGSGGPLSKIQNDLKEKYNFTINVTLTDLYPNPQEISKIQKETNGVIKYHEKPVDATQVPESFKGFTTMFCALHHFPPDLARKILQDTVNKKRGIGVFEMQKRSLWTAFLLIISMPPGIWLLTPCMKPFSWSRLFWTYVIPIVPFFMVFDGIISCIRTYTKVEMEELIRSVEGHQSYDWIITEETRLDFPPTPIVILIGTPKQNKKDS